jgi:peptidoglycan/LPS O-acetylase OafA/YrhL
MGGDGRLAATDKLPGLHALRFFAATAVFILHTVFWSARWVEPVLNFVNSYFQLGVQLFYVVSAFALMHSTRIYEKEPTWAAQFYLKRFFRIAPLFYLMIPITMVHLAVNAYPAPSNLEVATNFLFINNFWPKFVYGIPFAGWSVSVEVLFYLVFPLLFVFIRTIRSAVILSVLAIVVGEVARRIFDSISLQIGVYGEFSFPANLRYFAFGILAFLVYDRMRQSGWGAKDAKSGTVAAYHGTFLALCGALLAVIVLFNDQMRPLYRVDMVVWGLLFATVTVWVTVRQIGILGWAPFQYLGERSYSLYLLHVLVMYYMRPVTAWVFEALKPSIGDWALAPAIIVTWIPVVIVSAISYRLIEQPGMALGKRIGRSLKRPRTAPAGSPERA